MTISVHEKLFRAHALQNAHHAEQSRSTSVGPRSE
jgi:hypothetical protein